jgi:hypothetical protein
MRRAQENPRMTLPNFFIVGAAKGGTTALYYYLSRQPDVFMSGLKEPHFFAYEGARPTPVGVGDQYLIDSAVIDIESYERLFEGARQRAIGEASTGYLFYPHVAARIAARLPRAKIIAVLRDPAERAFSAFTYLRREGREVLKDFEAALDAEPSRRASGWAPLWSYVEGGRYARQLEPYYAAFPSDQIKVVLSEDLEADTRGVVGEVLRFLGIDAPVVGDLEARFNVSGEPRSQSLNRLYRFLSQPHPIKPPVAAVLPVRVRKELVGRSRSFIERINQRKVSMPAAARARVCRTLYDDTVALEHMLGRDLTSWRE